MGTAVMTWKMSAMSLRSMTSTSMAKCFCSTELFKEADESDVLGMALAMELQGELGEEA